MDAAPQTKRAAPARTTRDTSNHDHYDTLSEEVGQAAAYVVVCPKSNGRRVPFQLYRSRAEAESVAEQLRRVGCAAIVDARP